MSSSPPWPRALAAAGAQIERPATGPEPGGEELLARLREGDLEALGELYDRHAGRVRAVAARIDRDSADDVTHEVFLKLWRKAHRYAGRASLSTWLYRLTVNAALDHHRRRRRRAAASLDDLPAAGTGGGTTEAAHRLALRAALAELPPRFRLPVVLRFYAGLDYGEIARVLGCREGTVASRLSRALARLGRKLGPRGGGGGGPA